MPSQVRLVDLPNKDKKDDGKAKEQSSARKSARPTVTADRDLKSRLLSCFTRIAEAADARGDDELAAVIREDSEVMAAGLVSLTRPFRALRTPVLLLLGIVEPIMAFSRIVRLMVERMMIRRTVKREERRQAFSDTPETWQQPPVE